MNVEPLFSKILIANRGEIAVRIAQTCREMGIRTVAVYSTADAGALHVRSTDEAFCIGPPSPLKSYLCRDAILRVARECNAVAIHPGYGFLAENAEFARAVMASGMTWIGPSADVIALMGDKVAAKELARSAGARVVPGYSGEDQSEERMTSEAAEIGYPIMIKAAAGGGGKGMRAVHEAAELSAALAGARREAKSSFGDDRVFLEKLIVAPRHVEIQILVDTHGNAVFLGERECSIQRRHQKVIEEAPSPILTPSLRDAMGSAAVRLARASGYINAGTVEFLFSGDTFYFLEMNTRIQVEHPVTEVVTGLDLVRLQIDIAANRSLEFAQADIKIRGHAIEARVYAEDAEAGFLPDTGTLELFRPPSGPGVRNDAGVEDGSIITPYYDPMLAKLVVHAPTRDAAVARLRYALDRYRAVGPKTNLAFLRWVATHPEFVSGRADIDFIETYWSLAHSPPQLPIDVLAGAALARVLRDDAMPVDRTPMESFSPWLHQSYWRATGVPRMLSFAYAGETHCVSVTPLTSQTWEVRTAQRTSTYLVQQWNAPRLTLGHDSSFLDFEIIPNGPRGGGLEVTFRGDVYRLESPPLLEHSVGRPTGSDSRAPTTPMPGTVVKVVVELGQRVAAHEPLVVLEAMKMEHVVEAPHAGVVRKILVTEGRLVAAGSPVVELEVE